MPQIIAQPNQPTRSNVYGFIAVVFLGAASLVQAVGSGMAFGPRQEPSGELLLCWGGLILGGIAVLLGAWGLIRPGRALSVVTIVIALPVLSFGVLHL
ncbi:MAG TPA: hypothetical protein VFT01_10855 [Homoserinimonas sp.]|nr:hypothetical protein [Homoserinimonas sp.]